MRRCANARLRMLLFGASRMFPLASASGEREMAPRNGLALIAVVLVAAGAAPTARGEEQLNDLIKAYQDESQKPDDREAALVKATNLSRALASKPERIGAFKESLKP